MKPIHLLALIPVLVALAIVPYSRTCTLQGGECRVYDEAYYELIGEHPYYKPHTTYHFALDPPADVKPYGIVGREYADYNAPGHLLIIGLGLVLSGLLLYAIRLYTASRPTSPPHPVASPPQGGVGEGVLLEDAHQS